ncbi:hypothetical protein QFC20_004338 [Naganishia adeliensis]|uniref:Uncharacterized protein n=1 Tax=Naganishia adeliensis TaxID=92952 RepID=A0ACC2W0J1_9TREE|nr:hypothetical protein QFC20_004338 [Naganishia adeliensis]
MLAATSTKSLIAAIAVSALASAAPHAIEKLHKSHDDNRTSCTAAPVVQIHPANRTDLCLGLTSPIPAQGNSSLGLSECNVVQPNNETRFYGWWDRIDVGVQGEEVLRLVNTGVCLEDNTQQILVANSTWCLGIGEYNAPEIQQCLPTEKGQEWVFA